MKNNKAIAVLSGGLDSAVALYDAIGDGYEVDFAISFDYGQKHVKELECAKEICKTLRIQHKVIDISSLSFFLNSSLTNPNADIPEGHYEEESMKQTVVPNRNLIMASIASAIAISRGAQTLIIGVHQGDHAIYPDCRPRFIRKLNRVLKISDWNKVKIHAPLLKMDKAEIVDLGDYLGVDFRNTWTCYKGGELACGKCGSCQERREAFEKNDLNDPLPYEDDIEPSSLRTENP